MKSFENKSILCIPLFVILFSSCLAINDSQIPPFVPGGAEPYTYSDLGLPDGTDETASLPVISQSERDAIGVTLQYMDDMDMMTDEFWRESSRAARTVLFVKPFSDAELDASLEETKAFPLGNTPDSAATVLARETQNADEFFGRAFDYFPEMTDEQLINLRLKLTISLVVIRMQMDNRDATDGIPEEIILMVREKTLGLRIKINEELIERGITSL